MKEKKLLMLGVILILIGLAILGNNLDLWKFDLFFKGWWTLFIIVPSVASLFNKEKNNASIIGIIIGVLLLLETRNYIPPRMVIKIFFPFVIILVGLSLIFRPKNRFKNGPEYYGIFSSCKEKVTDNFNGGTCTAVFGGINLDLRNAKITEDITINSVAIFGGVDIMLPKNVILKSDGIAIFGGSLNKYHNQDKTQSPIVYINYVNIFGGTEIK